MEKNDMQVKQKPTKRNLIVRIENEMRDQLNKIADDNKCRLSDAVRCLLENALESYYERSGTGKLGERITKSFRKS